MLGHTRRLAFATVLLLTACGANRGPGPSYTAQAPTPGALYTDGQTGRFLLGGQWLYRSDRRRVGLARGWWRDASATAGWSAVAVPNAYNARNLSRAGMAGYVGWYRKDFTLPGGAFASYVPAGARRWIIRFESVNYRATVWLNGHRLGSHTGAYLPFELDLDWLNRGVNRLIVRVDDRRSSSDLPSGPSGGWWNYGGLLREVYLRAVAGTDVTQVVVRPALPCPTCAATIQERVLLRNMTSRQQTVELRGEYGASPVRFGLITIAPRATYAVQAGARIAHPRLWAPGHAVLYAARLTLSDSLGRPIGGYVSESGIRSITVTRAGHLELNGRPLHLRGVNLHEQALGLGGALDPAQLRRMMGWVEALGATVIRAHYPLNPEIEEMADRDGILIWSEIPVWGVRSQHLSSSVWLAQAHLDLEQNILVNENHPSVLLWSIGNELATPAPPVEASYIAGAAALAHRLDPTRPVAMAIADWPGIPCQSAYAPLDVIGLNEYFGWFNQDGRTANRAALGPFLDRLRACYPTRALMVTEFGFEANRHGPVTRHGTYEFQSDAVAYHLHVFAARPWLSGAIYFLAQDFASRPGWGGGDPRPDPPWVQKGLVDAYGHRKPAFAVVVSIYHRTMQIAPAAPPRRPPPRHRPPPRRRRSHAAARHQLRRRGVIAAQR